MSVQLVRFLVSIHLYNNPPLLVGNISYDVTEDQIKNVFSRVGTIVHFRLVHDRDTGRPKGFGFCEFIDVPTAEAAIRNFNGFELNGRPLRVDSAASSERNVEEVEFFRPKVCL
jgi:cleavage stimulation factor subunit 2